LIRSCQLPLKFATKEKQQAISALLKSYRTAVNFYIKHFWINKGTFKDGKVVALLTSTRLSERFKTSACKQAFDICKATRHSVAALNKTATMPKFYGSMILDKKFIDFRLNDTISFDLFMGLSCLNKGYRLHVPLKKTSILNKWLEKPGAHLKNGCAISENRIVVWVELPEPLKKAEGLCLGIDIGVSKLISLSDGTHIGLEFKQIKDKIKRKQSGSAAYKRALKERDNFFHMCTNKLPWSELKLLAIEDLKDLKKGKSLKRGKTFRKAMIPWTYRRVIEGCINKAEENGVYLQKVDPAYTSQTCPTCGKVSKNNRKTEDFCCVDCGYSQDADSVGAMNVLAKALQLVGSVESPALLKSLTEANINTC
jgi:IS605 OrfB family transposase